jgi:thiol-disulfide isomerase/thioredoxin
MTLRIGKVQKWWEKGHQPNMREVTSAQDLVDSLLKAGDKLVIVDFFSPGCGGCKALHPKVLSFTLKILFSLFANFIIVILMFFLFLFL